MPEEKTDAEEKANADEIRDVDATQDGARGNVHSRPGEAPQHEAPPPLPH